jgi:hypothetical protein
MIKTFAFNAKYVKMQITALYNDFAKNQKYNNTKTKKD